LVLLPFTEYLPVSDTVATGTTVSPSILAAAPPTAASSSNAHAPAVARRARVIDFAMCSPLVPAVFIVERRCARLPTFVHGTTAQAAPQDLELFGLDDAPAAAEDVLELMTELQRGQDRHDSAAAALTSTSSPARGRNSGRVHPGAPAEEADAEHVLHWPRSLV